MLLGGLAAEQGTERLELGAGATPIRCAEEMKMVDRDQQEKDEYRKHPFTNLKDSIDRTQMGDLHSLSKLGCWPTVVIIVVGIILFLLSKY
ncbi:hypothetical protein A6764_03045 [Brevibacillus sp. WF146]|uniref:hypothetical protein n=1 Tax=Brevibacillus sp. WF146 TaxID=319501 RepID=UPI000800F3C6|nr:hypothetical protein [Brevibacillus sp. WF146]UYZ13972.1 hypothetical protein A6764_03045 [Brevibacillus sp. WF146]